MAGSSSGGGGGKKKARIEIIPLIDVIFFLLATFVLFTLALNKSNGLPVKLPDAASGEKRDPANSVTITVTAEGTLAWDKDPVTLQEFLDRLQQYKLREANPKVPSTATKKQCSARRCTLSMKSVRPASQRFTLKLWFRLPGSNSSSAAYTS